MSSDLRNDEATNVDEIFRRVGRFGRYQMTQTFQIFVGIVPVSFNVLGIIFMISNVPMQCHPMGNVSLMNFTLSSNSQIVYKQCEVEIHSNGNVTDHLPCGDNGYFYPNGKHISLKSEWDLVCDKENLAELIIISYNIGKLVGCYILSTFADKYGRKQIYIITHLLLSAVNIANTFAPTYLFYLGAKSLAGFLESGMAVTCPIMLAELFPTEDRTTVMIFAGIAWSVSIMFMALVAYILEPFGWRYLNLFIGLMSVYSVIQFWTYNESLRWLLARAKWAQADDMIKTICKTNKVEYNQIAPLLNYRHTPRTNGSEKTEAKSDEAMKMIPVKKFANHDPKEEQRKEKTKELPGLIYILCNPVLRRILFVCMYAWFVNALVYYGLYMMLSLSENKFLSFFLNGVMEVAAHLLTIKLIFRLGRKRSCALFQTMSGLSIITAVILTYFAGDNYGMQIGSIIFSLIGMFSISASFLCIWFYTPEMFPTNVRNVGLATSSTASRIGNMLAPFSNALANYVSWGPGMVFGALCLLCNVFIVLLPETGHRQLPQTAEDVEEWHNESREKKRNKNKIIKDKERQKEENNLEFL